MKRWSSLSVGVILGALGILATANLTKAIEAWGWDKWLLTFAPQAAPYLLHPLTSLIVVAVVALAAGFVLRPYYDRATLPAIHPAEEAVKLGREMRALRGRQTGFRGDPDHREFLAEFWALNKRAERFGLTPISLWGGQEQGNDTIFNYAHSYMRDVTPYLLQGDIEAAKTVAAAKAAEIFEHSKS